MNILFYRYGSICEPDMISAFETAGLNVIEINKEITDKKLTDADRITLVTNEFNAKDILFVFTINFYPAISEVCKIYNKRYLFWTVDSPVHELYAASIANPTNRAFLFDGAQYNEVKKYNPDLAFHLPLAAATDRFDNCIASVTDEDRAKFASDISFVGSLYLEKDPIGRLEGLSDYAKGYIKALTEVSLKIFGYYPVKDSLNNMLLDEIKACSGKDFYCYPDTVEDVTTHVISHGMMAYHIAAEERIRTLNALADRFSVNLFTRSDTSLLKKVNNKGGVRTLDEMPKVFNLSKINLNMTMRAIETGLPLRIFDIMGSGGFLMTNYQPELEEMFVIGQDVEAYTSIEELIDKCDYYLKNEDIRRTIALNGYEKVKNNHTYFHRLRSMLEVV